MYRIPATDAMLVVRAQLRSKAGNLKSNLAVCLNCHCKEVLILAYTDKSLILIYDVL